jgi:ketosteroid isomerase-like protein
VATPSVAPAADDVRATIEAAGKQFVADFHKGDAAALAGYYAEDAMVLPPNADFVKGRAAIQAFWQSFVGAGYKHFALSTLEVGAGGDLAYEVGTYEVGTAPDAVDDRGKFLVVWKKAGGKWWIHRDMFSSNMPAAPAAPAPTGN